MPIVSTVEGNLIGLALSGAYTEIAHGCNCFNAMGAGIAVQIAKTFPKAAEVDMETSRGDKDKLGTMTYADIKPWGKGGHTLTVHNLYIQYGTGGYLKGTPDIDYIALRAAFELLNKDTKNLKEGSRRGKGYYNELNIQQLCGIPKIGSERAGGDWDIISRIIDEVTPDVDIELVIYNP
jgi:O-acetyl-ADP-ribose deacetylase (regulator of RNase III)